MPEETATEVVRSWWLTPQGTLSFSWEIAPLHVLLAYCVLSVLAVTWAMGRIYADSKPEEWGGCNAMPPFPLAMTLMLLFAPITMPFAVAYVFTAVGYKPRPLP